MVVGDGQPYIAALVTLDVESLPAWLTAQGKATDTPVADLATDPDVVAAIQGAVDDANKAVSKAESIRKFQILPVDWTEEGGELTPSLKLKRNVVMKSSLRRWRGCTPDPPPGRTQPHQRRQHVRILAGGGPEGRQPGVVQSHRGSGQQAGGRDQHHAGPGHQGRRRQYRADTAATGSTQTQ